MKPHTTTYSYSCSLANLPYGAGAKICQTANPYSYNRYSYAINNPLKYSDPGGWSWTAIDAANHANMMAMTMMGRLHNKFQASGIRSGSSSNMWGDGSGFGSNAIIFQNAEATLQMDLTAIAHILSSVFGQAGLFGNPRGGDTPEYDYSSGADFTSGDGWPPDGSANYAPWRPTIVNESDNWIYYLPNKSENYQIGALPPLGKYYGEIDGVATCKYDRFVFKVPDYGSVTILQDGDVALSIGGIRALGWIVQHFSFGNPPNSWGWKDRYFFNEDDFKGGWDDLFNSLDTY